MANTRKFKVNDNVELNWNHWRSKYLETPFGRLDKNSQISLVVEELLEIKQGYNDVRCGVYSKETLEKLGDLYFQESSRFLQPA